MRKQIETFKVFEKSGNVSKIWGNWTKIWRKISILKILKKLEADQKHEEKKCGNGSKIWGNGPKILGNPSKIFQWKKAEMDLKFWKIEQKKRKLSKSDFWGISEKFREIVEINKKWVIWLVSAYFR